MADTRRVSHIQVSFLEDFQNQISGRNSGTILVFLDKELRQEILTYKPGKNYDISNIYKLLIKCRHLGFVLLLWMIKDRDQRQNVGPNTCFLNLWF